MKRMVCRSSCNRSSERGVALIVVLLAMLILSALGAGIIASTQSEIWSSANYRSTVQARFVAEAGAQQALSWLRNNYVTDGTTTTSALSAVDLTKAPVVYNGTCSSSPCIIRMTSDQSTLIGGVDDTVKNLGSSALGLESGFATALQPSATSAQFDSLAGPGKSYFKVAAQLLQAYNTGNGWVSKWKITSQGTVGGLKPATAQVIEIVESKPGSSAKVPTQLPGLKFGAFANSNQCGSMVINGGSSVVSYDSSKQPGDATPDWTYASGDVGTLGNLNLSGSGLVYGNVYAPGYNVGNKSASVYWPYGVSGGGSWPYYNGEQACSSSSMYAVNQDRSGGQGIQCTKSGKNTVCANKASQLGNQACVTNSSGTTTCTDISSGYGSADTMVGSTKVSVPANNTTCNFNAICNGGSGGGNPNLTLPSSTSASNVVNYGNASFGGSTITTLSAGSYFFNTLNLGGSAQFIVPNAPVSIYIMDSGNASTPLNITGGSFSNSGGDPVNLTFIYNGTNTVHVGSISSNTLFASIYAPNAKVVFDGNGSIYGSIIGKTVSITGGGHVIYDTHLGNTPTQIYTDQVTQTPTPLHVTQFSWSVF